MMARSRRDARRTARLAAQQRRTDALAAWERDHGFTESPTTPGLYTRIVNAQ